MFFNRGWSISSLFSLHSPRLPTQSRVFVHAVSLSTLVRQTPERRVGIPKGSTRRAVPPTESVLETGFFALVCCEPVSRTKIREQEPCPSGNFPTLDVPPDLFNSSPSYRNRTHKTIRSHSASWKSRHYFISSSRQESTIFSQIKKKNRARSRPGTSSCPDRGVDGMHLQAQQCLQLHRNSNISISRSPLPSRCSNFAA